MAQLSARLRPRLGLGDALSGALRRHQPRQQPLPLRHGRRAGLDAGAAQPGALVDLRPDHVRLRDRLAGGRRGARGRLLLGDAAGLQVSPRWRGFLPEELLVVWELPIAGETAVLCTARRLSVAYFW